MTEKEMPFIPIVVTIGVIILWALFMLLYVLFWSNGFNLFQNIVLILLSLVVVGGVIALMWVTWVFRWGERPRMPMHYSYFAFSK